MNPSLVKTLLAEWGPNTQLLYGVATGDNTVTIGGSTVAVTLPALTPVASGDYCAVLVQGADRLILGPVHTSGGHWTAPTLGNSWVNFGAGVQAIEYRKVGDIVYLRGMMKSGTLNSAAFTLPTGFRPPAHLYFPVASNGAFGMLYVETTGVVNPLQGSNADFSLEGVYFSTTA